MTPQRRRDTATATVGLAGVATAGGLRHAGLDAAYGEEERPRMFQERKFLTRAKVPGRRRYAVAAGLGLVSVPPAAVGTSRLMRRETASKRDERRSFIGEGLQGAKASLVERNKTAAARPPAKLVAGNYAAGAGVASMAGGATHLALRRMPGVPRSAAAAVTGLVAGSASLPAQSKLTERASRGKYEVTPTGVRRRRTKAVRPSRGAQVVEARPGKGGPGGHQLRQELVGKGRIPTSGHFMPRSPKLDRALTPSERAQVRAKLDEAAQTRVKKDDPGATMSRGERRARVTAAGVPIPVVGDIAQATMAASLSPEKYRTRTAVQNYAGGTGGQLAGTAAGGAGALALARRSPRFDRKAQAANDKIDSFKTSMRSRARLKPVTGPGLGERALQHKATPAIARRGAAAVAGTRVARAVAANPKVAAVGALAGGSIGGQVGQQSTYSAIMRRDDRYRRQHNQGARRGSKVGKADEGSGMSRREELGQIRRKQRAAAVGATTSLGSVASLGLLGAAALPKVSSARRGKLVRASLITGTAAGGVAAVNGLEGAHLQRKDLRAREKALVGKSRKGVLFGAAGGTAMVGAAAYGRERHHRKSERALRVRLYDEELAHQRTLEDNGPRAPKVVHKAVLRPTGIRRVPGMRRGFFRQTRTAAGPRTTYVRGGLA